MEFALYTEHTHPDYAVIHAFNSRQPTFGRRNFAPDVYIPEIDKVLLFHGCHVHK